MQSLGAIRSHFDIDNKTTCILSYLKKKECAFESLEIYLEPTIYQKSFVLAIYQECLSGKMYESYVCVHAVCIGTLLAFILCNICYCNVFFCCCCLFICLLYVSLFFNLFCFVLFCFVLFSSVRYFFNAQYCQGNEKINMFTFLQFNLWPPSSCSFFRNIYWK